MVEYYLNNMKTINYKQLLQLLVIYNYVIFHYT